jgi:NAD(P)-dependent dehydrogenase (short-subunit alcohol dehydrogenase family)
MPDTAAATVVVTGASAGIGAAAAVELTRRGHSVLAVGRTPSKLAAVRATMQLAAPEGLDVPEPVAADLASLGEVTSLAEAILERCPRIDVLANNAGLIVSSRQETVDGHEMIFAVNHLAPFLLTSLLVARLQASGGRVITTSSEAHQGGRIYEDDLQLRQGWGRWKAYCQSKLANVLFTSELARRTGLPATAFHPGLVRTDFGRGSLVKLASMVVRPLYRSPEQGAETLVWLATDPEGAEPSATYYTSCKPGRPSSRAEDAGLASRLWEASAALVAMPAPT